MKYKININNTSIKLDMEFPNNNYDELRAIINVGLCGITDKNVISIDTKGNDELGYYLLNGIIQYLNRDVKKGD